MRKKASESFKKVDGSSCIIRRNQFPVTEGFAAIAHKKQGSTLKQAVISLESGQGVASYVKRSRTSALLTPSLWAISPYSNSRSNLHLAGEFSESILPQKWYYESLVEIKDL
jgi:hypothetical protein